MSRDLPIHDTLTGFLRDLDRRLTRLERQPSAKGGAASARSVGPAEPPTVFQATQPTAADYGLPSIPVGAVWVQSDAKVWDGSTFT